MDVYFNELFSLKINPTSHQQVSRSHRLVRKREMISRNYQLETRNK